MNARRLPALALAALLLCSGCGSTLPGSDPGDLGDPILSPNGDGLVESAPAAKALCFSATDSLNPFHASTRVNQELAYVLYEGLTKLDDRWEPQPAMADTITLTDDTHIKATLRPDAVYATGAKVTAADVAASFTAARSSDVYEQLLSNIQSVSAEQDGSVSVTLKDPDPHYQAALSFPVVPAGETGNSQPACSGPYYRDEKDEEDRLLSNPYYRVKPAVPEWALCDRARDDEQPAGLESGEISCFFTDLSSGEPLRMSAGAGVTLPVPMNYLVFLGINSNKKMLSDKKLRAALSDTVNRASLCREAYAGLGTEALTPFHPYFAGAEGLTGFTPEENISKAVARLNDLGYNTRDVLIFELLVDSGNPARIAAAALLAEQMQAAGVTVNVVKLSKDKLLTRVKRGQFELYMGEVRLGADLSLRPLLESGGGASYGVPKAARSDYTQYLDGDLSAQEFCDAFVKEVPFIPLCYRSGMAVGRRELKGFTPTGLNPYYGIETWTWE